MAADNTDRLADSVNKVSVGRVYDYLLGGVHNYAVDQAFAEEQLRILPDIRDFARSNRAFLGRAVRFAVSEGVRQFVDIGSGLPTQGNVHEVADEVAPGQCRVVYIDNEPIAQAHAEILLEQTADPQRHRALDADFFDGALLWQRVLDTGLIDTSEPVCLLAVALLHFMPPQTQPQQMLSFYVGKLPKGSLLALSHIHVDPEDAETLAASEKVSASYRAKANNPAMPRSREDIAAFFDGLELVDPGLVWLPEWRPAGQDPFGKDPRRSRGLAGVGRKV
ncbi:O-methyltransferase involved in polyketide biosynthesis [Saccharomonospora amisosensis]|uniref:O-methyltransferase involved in polyketide biosynthesis n=1 Tax=Saccharomonospora amisosensis TaxID=1128677 RepID=A0A7X5ZQR6_9PSEU|nr:SAM-dependent methyltransferase [Saccharomonospora amisosensis]NIJ12057.1 O-methyltransferase involved in polyketide biosynthesis [Saccharomonospora amisosensis]